MRSDVEPELLDRQPVLEGDLLLVRPLETGDFDALRAVASDPLIWEQHPAKERSTPEGFRLWFDKAMASGGALVVIDRSDREVIGSSRYDALDAERREVEIGWTFLARSRWGGTFNGELKRLMIDHALAAVDSVVFRVHGDNHRSQKAVQKLGGVHLETGPVTDGPGEVVTFRLGRDRWRQG